MPIETRCRECQAPLTADVPEGLCPKCLLRAAMATQFSAAPTGLAGGGPGALPDPAQLARLFPHLEILELVGQGGMGAVYKARQPALDRLVALKILPPVAGTDQGFAERFAREARALARLSHPNIVAVYEFGQLQGLHYLILEYVDGLNLRQLERAARLTPPQALAWIPQICEALQFAHDQGVVHRDIKPENVLIDRKGRVKITDFGLAKLLGRDSQDWRLTGVADVMGTPHYMAPEQVEHPREVDHRADIYSLGVVFYEMLTGELPLGKFAPPSRKAVVDTRLDEVVLHALEKEPERRYQQASQVKLDLETIARGGTGLNSRDGRGAAQRRPEPRPWTARLLAAAATVLLAGFGVYWATTRPGPRATRAEPVPGGAARVEAVDLLQQYPTTLAGEDTVPANAREWQFTQADIFRLSRFELKIGPDFILELGEADLGLGHCQDGAVWAVLVPRAQGHLLSQASQEGELVSQVWLRFHPREVGRLFPPRTVLGAGTASLVAPMQAVAKLKIVESWHADGRAMIPPPNRLTVDVETTPGVRRFFAADTATQQAEYVAEFR